MMGSWSLKRKPARTVPALAITIAALSVAVLIPGGASARTGLEGICDAPTYVQGLGMACPDRDGLYTIAFEDGTLSRSHGPDLFSGAWAKAVPAFGSVLRNPVCVKNARSQYHHKALYVHAQDQPDRYGQFLGEIRSMVKKSNGFLYEESKAKGRPLQYRTHCTPSGAISVDTVRAEISSTRRDTLPIAQDYITVVNAVRRAGYTNPFAKYWIYYDGRYPGGAPIGGVASGALDDDRLLAENWNNFGPGYGVYYGLSGDLGASVMMHEDAHTMGAVAVTSPNSSKGFHCNDGQDIMCYQDGGSASDAFTNNVCSRMQFDCNKNDYFNPKPPKGSYLAAQWNLGSPLNRFFQGCLYRTGHLTGAGGPEAGSLVADQAREFGDLTLAKFSIKTACRGDIYALSGAVSPLPKETDDAVGLTPHTQLPFGVILGDRVVPSLPVVDSAVTEVAHPDFDICFYNGKTLIRCDTELGTDQGKVPVKATRAVIGAKEAVTGIYVFSAI
jgi:hypothetical protein